MSPWIGKPNEAQVKEEIMNLSADRRNFVRAPPAAVDFQFDYDVSYPVAQAIMAEDTALEKMRFELVPKMWVQGAGVGSAALVSSVSTLG